MRPSSLLASSLVVLMSGSAMAGSIFLNGVNIDGVTSQKFEKVTVKIDERGNIHIDAPGYAAKVVGAGGGATPSKTAPTEAADDSPGKITKRYWLVTEQTVPGMTDFDIDVYINSKWVRKLRNNEEQIITEVTKHLVPGRNSVLLTARKQKGGTPRSYSAEHIFRVIIGEGNVGGDNVMIDNPIVNFKRSAAETDDVSQEVPLVTR